MNSSNRVFGHLYPFTHVFGNSSVQSSIRYLVYHPYNRVFSCSSIQPNPVFGNSCNHAFGNPSIQPWISSFIRSIMYSVFIYYIMYPVFHPFNHVFGKLLISSWIRYSVIQAFNCVLEFSILSIQRRIR